MSILRDALTVVPIDVIKGVVDTLADLGVAPLHLRVDTKRVGDTRPDVSLWMQTRTDYDHLVAHLKAKSVEHPAAPAGQRSWCAEHDTTQRRLLIQVVSFAHHDDWAPRPGKDSR